MVPHTWPELHRNPVRRRNLVIGFNGVFRQEWRWFRRQEATRMSLTSFPVIVPSKTRRRVAWKCEQQLQRRAHNDRGRMRVGQPRKKGGRRKRKGRERKRELTGGGGEGKPVLVRWGSCWFTVRGMKKHSEREEDSREKW